MHFFERPIFLEESYPVATESTLVVVVDGEIHIYLEGREVSCNAKCSSLAFYDCSV